MAATYSDISFSIDYVPNEIVADADAINQNITIIFDTPIRSKWFRPRNGSNVNRWLFDPIDDVTAQNIKHDMELALYNNQEFRVQFTSIVVIPDYDNTQYYVEIQYIAPELEKQNQTFVFNLSRGIAS